ncbi:MAG: hypothetical protein K6E54_00725, partial [Bacteroidaceae bacterium]|nr:hypothetical protein [Bacteroidaceae bacterium]
MILIIEIILIFICIAMISENSSSIAKKCGQVGSTCGFYTMNECSLMITGKQKNQSEIADMIRTYNRKNMTNVGEIFNINDFEKIFKESYPNLKEKINIKPINTVN